MKHARIPAGDSKALSQLDRRIPAPAMADANLGEIAPRLCVYPRETVVAEKFEAMVYLGTLNTRMKDCFDIWLLARQFDFAGAELACDRKDL